MKQLSGAAVLLVSLGAFGRPTLAATRTPVTFSISSVTVLSPGTEWSTANTLHIRGERITGTVTGDLAGTIAAVVDQNLNVTNPVLGFTGTQIRATFTLTTATVTWVGTITDSGPPDRGTNLVEAHGTDGSSLFGGIFGQPDGTFLVQGTIITP